MTDAEAHVQNTNVSVMDQVGQDGTSQTIPTSTQPRMSVPLPSITGSAPSTEKASQPKSNLDAKSPSSEPKALSGAELKKRAKADKAGRRERERLQNKPAQAQQSQQNGMPTGGKVHRRDSTVGGTKPHQVPSSARSSTMAVHDRPLPLRSSHPAGTGSSSKLPPISSQNPSSAKKDTSKQVALFSHLYTQPRRTSISHTSRDVHPSVLALGLQFTNYVICGSSARCVAILLVFKRVISSYTTPPSTTLTRHLPSHLSLQIDHLVSCRPLSTSMGNAIRWLKLEISTVDISTRDSDAKAHLCASIDNFIRDRITVADQVIATSASAKISPGDTILTYARSSIVLQTLLQAHQKHQALVPPPKDSFRVIIIDSRPLFEGRSLARSLVDSGIPVTYSHLSGLSHAITSATKVLLGAHAMMSNGRLYSRVGTAAVAMSAHMADVPVIVCCESVKFTEKVALDSIVSNEVAPAEELVGNQSSDGDDLGSFNVADQGDGKGLQNWKDVKGLQLLNLMYDVTPAEYIDMVITEYGSLPPSSVPVVYRLSTNT